MKLTDFKALSFDCYGTLIDWESGLLAALAPLLEQTGGAVSAEEALTAFGEIESEIEAASPTMLYPRILAAVHVVLAERWGVEAGDEDHRRFGASVPDWPAFPDSAAALEDLSRHYKLIILSNVDRESFAGSNRRLGVTFDAVYTAEEIGSYKPSPANFEFLIERLQSDFGLQKHELLHTAQSLFHDHAPAKRFGLATAWIDRRADTKGWGATPPPTDSPTPDFRFHTLAELAAARRAEP